MSTVQNTTSSSNPLAAFTSSASGVASASSTASDIQDRFLKLLVTQLKNQDPLNPMDNAQLTSQLSQISTVSGIEKLNTTMQSLSDSFMSAQSLQSAGLIGHTVYADGNSLAFDGSAAVGGGINLSQAADSVAVSIVGPAGNVVRQINLGAGQAGLSAFQWDGLSDSGAKAAAGAYTFKVTASSGGQAVPATTFMSGQVSSVLLSSDGAHAMVNGVGDVPVSQIKQIM